MRVLHTIEGMEARYGGIASCTADLLPPLQNGKDTVDLLTFSPTNPDGRLLGEGESWLKTVKNDGVGPIGYSRNIKHWLSTHSYDLFHVNGLWQHIAHQTCKTARNSGKPYVLTPHGMLYATALKISGWKKWPMRKLWFDKDIMRADCIHATCEEEMANIRRLGYKGPVAIIGNPIKIPDFVDKIVDSRQKSITMTSTGQRIIGCLGRLHPIKKYENIIQGMAQSKHKDDIRLLIMGAGDQEYETFLRNEVRRFGLEDRVDFAGFVNGEEKFRRLARLSALFVPSDMENFGMIVPEALLVGTPVMSSLGTPWEMLNEHDCGWWRDNSPESIAGVIDEMTAMSPDELLEKGLRGRQLVIERYRPDKVAAKMMRLYRWLSGRGEKSEFVYES